MLLDCMQRVNCVLADLRRTFSLIKYLSRKLIYCRNHLISKPFLEYMAMTRHFLRRLPLFRMLWWEIIGKLLNCMIMKIDHDLINQSSLVKVVIFHDDFAWIFVACHINLWPQYEVTILNSSGNLVIVRAFLRGTGSCARAQDQQITRRGQ